MKPIILITDTTKEKDNEFVREKMISFLGIVLHKHIECFPVSKDKPIGFSGPGINLTYVEEDE